MKKQNKYTILLKFFFVITLLTLTYLSSCANFLNEKVYENSDSDGTSSGDSSSGGNSSSGDEDNTSVHVESSIFGATTTIDDHYVYSFEAIKDVPYKLSWTTSAGAKISVHAGTVITMMAGQSDYLRTANKDLLSPTTVSNQTVVRSTNGHINVAVAPYDEDSTGKFTLTVSNEANAPISITKEIKYDIVQGEFSQTKNKYIYSFPANYQSTYKINWINENNAKILVTSSRVTSSFTVWNSHFIQAADSGRTFTPITSTQVVSPSTEYIIVESQDNSEIGNFVLFITNVSSNSRYSRYELSLEEIE